MFLNKNDESEFLGFLKLTIVLHMNRLNCFVIIIKEN